jgi:hypothetical protein
MSGLGGHVVIRRKMTDMFSLGGICLPCDYISDYSLPCRDNSE